MANVVERIDVLIEAATAYAVRVSQDIRRLCWAVNVWQWLRATRALAVSEKDGAVQSLLAAVLDDIAPLFLKAMEHTP